MIDSPLLARLERIEAQLAIQQLPSRYALAVDTRNLDDLTALFTPDVNCGRWGQGREALKAFYASNTVLRGFYRSIHQICGHVIDWVDADHATGKVYCRAEHEDGDKWVVMAICYLDSYVRCDGQWYFDRRDEQHWYSTDWLERPGTPKLQNWPGKHDSPSFDPKLPHRIESWSRFWQDCDPDLLKRLTRFP